MAVSLVLLAAVIAAVNGRPELSGGAEEGELLGTNKTDTHCSTTVSVIYPSPGKLPYPLCSSWCNREEEEIWSDGVVFTRLSELMQFDLMVEMTYKNRSLQGCKMVPYETAQESLARQDANESQIQAPVPSVTERIPKYVPPFPIHKRLEGFTRVGNSYYIVSPYVMNWHNAVKYCDKLGASLALIDTSYEQSQLKGVLSIIVWIGVNDIEEEGIFVSEGNTPIKNSQWMKDEPNNRWDAEDCVAARGDSELQWNDFRCNNQYHALCKHPPVDEPQAQYSCPRGYWKHKSSCYILSSTLDTYSIGEEFCLNRSAYPVFINSQAEHDFLAEKQPGFAYIGYSDSEDEGMFLSSRFGLPLFKSWKDGEPNDKGKSEDCVVIKFMDEYLWNDISCDAKTKILCEKAAEIRD